MITVCAFSDGHGVLPVIEKPFDLLLMAGDNINLYYQKYPEHTFIWYTNDFVNWVNKLPFNDINSKVIFICGNHEVGFEKMSHLQRDILKDELKRKTGDRIIYLENESTVFSKGNEKLTIFGSPYCKQYGNWAYNKTQSALDYYFSYIPKDCDILLTHDAPFGVSDKCFGWTESGRTPESIGCEALRDAILQKTPRINLHGHLHTANHNVEKLGETDVYCISLVDENYDYVYEPLYLEL